MIPARRRGLLVVIALALAACSTSTPTVPTSEPASPGAVPASDGADAGARLVLRRETGPRPGPVKPFRGVMVEEVQVYEGFVSARFVLKNTGEEPITFLNTLYDYEPNQLYEPLLRVEWEGGDNAVATRQGRFFPSPAILQPGEEGVYLLGGRESTGSGQLGEMVTHIKYCPTRGMDDRPALPLEVTDLSWESSGGITTVRGTVREVAGLRRGSSPTIGVAFQDDSGSFVGAVVADAVGAGMDAHEERSFEISGTGVFVDAIASAHGYAWVR